MTLDAVRATTKLVKDADKRRRSATTELNQDARSDLGQFLTPADVARLMASLFGPLPSHVRLLDAGAGIGGLTAAFVAEACSRSVRPKTIAATAFELEDVLIPHLRETFSTCRRTCDASSVEFSGRIDHNDFLEAAADVLDGSLFGSKFLKFDAAILNPPYRKIGTDSRERRLVQRAGLDATNLYAAFVALAVRLLVPGAQLVAIIPRSFCNGPYFRPFREVLLKETALLRIHVFASRKDAFKDDRVLQENVILHATKSPKTPRRVVVSTSHSGSADVQERRLEYNKVVREANGDRFIHLPTDKDDDAISRWMEQLPDTLQSLGLVVSTGRVVDFRAREHLLGNPNRGSAPLIYPCHFLNGQVRWPKVESRKPNAIASNAETEALLVPQGYYVVTKRFSSKEEKRRIVAAVYDPELVQAPLVGFENHLNYFHCKGRGMPRDVAYGLAAFLNSEPMDRYFRQFNGHTQVNANDLRSLSYPSQQVLKELGREQLRPGSSELEVAVLEKYPIN
jgi:adenine-specific DNA-methyltransferase